MSDNDGCKVFYDHEERYVLLSIEACFNCKILGEIFELKNELSSEKKEKKREAVKKVIASMTVGKDVR